MSANLVVLIVPAGSARRPHCIKGNDYDEESVCAGKAPVTDRAGYAENVGYRGANHGGYVERRGARRHIATNRKKR